MPNKVPNIILRYIVPGVIVLVGFAALGLVCYLHQYTMVAWWSPVLVCFPLAALAGCALSNIAHAMTGFRRWYANALTAAAFMFTLFLAAFYSLNYYKSRSDSSVTYQATVLNKISEEHYRTRRISRHHSVRGEKYRVYSLLLQMPDGKTKEVRVTPEQFIRCANGRPITVNLEQGLFGIPVIKNLKLPSQKAKISNCRKHSHSITHNHEKSFYTIGN